jgi:methionine-rich copper-binding protein CopC
MVFIKIASAALAVLLSFNTPTAAVAHDQLLSASPAADLVTSTPTTELRLQFSEEFELALTSVAVSGPGGAVIATGLLAADPIDTTVLVVPLAAPLPSGDYVVDWRVVAKDGHGTNGTYQFSSR